MLFLGKSSDLTKSPVFLYVFFSKRDLTAKCAKIPAMMKKRPHQTSSYTSTGNLHEQIRVKDFISQLLKYPVKGIIIKRTIKKNITHTLRM
jgi:hypothetical protein